MRGMRSEDTEHGGSNERLWLAVHGRKRKPDGRDGGLNVTDVERPDNASLSLQSMSGDYL